MIPVYIVTGLLGTGKSTLINQELRERKKLGSTEIITFELGNIVHIKEPLTIEPDDIEISPAHVILQIENHIVKTRPKEIWIEWNGMFPFQQLESIFFSQNLKELCHIERVIYTAKENTIRSMIQALGPRILSQIYSADYIILYPTDSTQIHSITQLLHAYNTECTILVSPSPQDIHNRLSRPKWPWILYGIVAILTLYLLLVTVFRHNISYSIHQVLAITSGIILEGMPFLLLGTVISTIITLFIPDRWLLRYMKEDSLKSYGIALGSGLCLPVCDCATIPMFNALLQRGIPQHLGLLFMLASPIMNPIALLATYYAFPEEPKIILARIIGGILIALIVALTFKWFPHKLKETQNKLPQPRDYEYTLPIPERDKKKIFLLHVEKEFSQLLLYFGAAAFTLALFQVWIKPVFFATSFNVATPIANALLLILAFIFSLCSTSDAIIGRTLSGLFPISAVLGFLWLGPMIDIKNVYILRQYMSLTFILRLVITISIVTYIMTVLAQFLFVI